MKLLCGLGNPGRGYQRTRHNIGFRVVEALGQKLRIELRQQKFEARIAEGQLGGERVLLIQPQTFMNLSGRSVSAAAEFFKVEPTDALVIHDELDLPFGRLQLKASGGAGGHNGLKSIMEWWGTDTFHRLRVGIGRPTPPQRDAIDYVLSAFTEEEENALGPVIEHAVEAAECWASEGLAVAMNRFNRRPPRPEADEEGGE